METFTLIIAISIILVIFGSKKYIVDRLRYGRLLPPGPVAMPLIGTLYAMRSSSKPWVNFKEIAKRYGPITLHYFGQERIVVLGTPSTIRDTIVANSKQFSDRAVMFVAGMKCAPMGVIFESGELWQKHRRFLMRSMRDFGMGQMHIVARVHAEVEMLIDNFQRVESQALNPRLLLATSVSNVICSLVFGKRYSHNDPDFARLFNCMETFTHTPVLLGVLHFMFPPIELLFNDITMSRANRLYGIVGDLLNKCLVEHRQDFDAEHLRHFPDLFIESERRTASASNNQADESSNISITFADFKNMMGDMFFAGSETTSTALQWTLLCLAKWPEIQGKCHRSVDAAIGGCDRLPTLSDRANLVYLDAVFHEVLRYASIVPLGIPHGAWSDLKVDALVIPEKTWVIYNIWALHHDEGYWGNPKEFDPSRWIDGEGKLISHSTHFMPFGIGPRICLGESLARIEYFIFIVALLQRFTISFPVGSPTVDMNDSSISFVHVPPPFEIVMKSR